MLNQEQIKIADFLLKYLYSVGGNSSLDDYPEKLRMEGFDKFEWNSLQQILIENLELIVYVGNSNYNIMLTPEGNNAAKIGIKKYLDEIKQDKQLDRDAKKSSISGVKNAKTLSIIAISASIIIPFSIEIFKNIVNKPSDINNNRQNGIELSNSQIPLNLTDTIFVEKVKNSLKHDTLFLEDIKDFILKSD